MVWKFTFVYHVASVTRYREQPSLNGGAEGFSPVNWRYTPFKTREWKIQIIG